MGVSACTVQDDLDADVLGHSVEVVTRVAPGPDEADCSGVPLPRCNQGHTGPACDYVCDDGLAACGFRYYCHADGRISGIAMSRAHLFTIDPRPTAEGVRDRFESWVIEHEADLGMPDGLDTSRLQLEPADNVRVDQELLTLWRFRQFYRASAALPEVPIVGDGSLLMVEADPRGAIAVKGTIVDPRAELAHREEQAEPGLAKASILRYASLATGVREEDIVVTHLHVVAVPSAQQLAWAGIASAGVTSIARVIVDADPGASGWLDALMIDHQDVHSLQNTTPISVRTQDPQQYPWDDPVAEIIADELPDATPLLGSIDDFSSEPQLANEAIVTVDMLGNSFSDLFSGAPFERYTDPVGEFHASQPSAQFNAQRAFQLTQAGRWHVDRVALGQWDSAVEWILMGAATSAYAPGQYRPRFMIGYDHASTGASAAALLAHPPSIPAVVLAFPEFYQRPAPGQLHECVSEVKLGPGTVLAHTLFHELGHSYDFFLAPSTPKENVSPCVAGCDTTCDEDTSDEANPLTETIAQMFALWQLRTVFPDLPHGTCELFSSYLTSGGSLNQKHIHSPECMGMDDQINMFVRDDDPACGDSTLCDKPHLNETDPSLGDPNVCDSTSGYNTFSILQAWWNMLNGLYCEPSAPFTCSPAAPQWPPGCALPASPAACVTPAEASGLAFVYAVRTNPLSYEELFDALARFVSCNYGSDAYDQFNQALCDHGIRPCGAVAPAMCETCGNGIREGGEECDGDDLSVPALGWVQTCVGLGYGGGTLACHDAASAMACTYDTSACMPAGLDDTGSGTDSSGSSSGSGSDSGTGPTGGGADGSGGGSGCGCRSANETGGTAGFGLMMLLALRRRVRGPRPAAWGSYALLVSLGLVGCADDCGSDGTSSTATTTQATETAEASTTHGVTTGGTAGWPEAWFGEFYNDPGWPVGIPLMADCSPGWFENIRVDERQLTVEGFACRGEIVLGSGTTYETEPMGNGLRVLPTEPSGEVVWLGDIPLATVVVRPGDACDELRAEFVGVTGQSVEGRWLRGRLCLIDPFDETIANDTYLVDLCEGATTECSDP